MWEARNRRRSDRRLEARLHSARPEADEALVRNIAGALEPRRQPRAWSRVAFAAAFTTFVVGSFASFGGISYAASGATNAVHTLTKLATAQKVVVPNSAAADQYSNPIPPGDDGQGPADEVQGVQSAGGVQGTASGTLPFTGLSLLATTLLGLAMIMTGLTLRRRERRKT
jgi:hypothetical protein